MSDFPLLDKMGDLPRPAYPEIAAHGKARWAEAVAARCGPESEALAAITAAPRAAALLDAIFGNSPYLTQSLLREPEFLPVLLTRPPGPIVADVLDEVRRTALSQSVEQVMATLRRARRKVALTVAVADIGGLWTLDGVVGALSDLAECALDAALARLLVDGAESGNIELADAQDPTRNSGLTVLGMGKLGARELNYSSDIDILVLFDQDLVNYRGRASPNDFFIRLTRALVRMLQERTAEGYVFRTDLRLRPDPGSTPIAMSMAAAESYYETLGQNWERAAMIKARVVAGDRAAGRAFFDRISPFVWRKYLDFAAIQDIHSIKRQIHRYRGHGALTVRGHNIKLGRGGIREIEFFAQTQQLIAGGRDRRLRVSGTREAIRALAASGRIGAGVADELIEAYEFLRRLEHHLQMIADEQTHTLPDTEAGMAHLAAFLGFADAAELETEVLAHLRHVQHHYAALFEDAPSLGDQGSLSFTGTEDDPETLETLTAMGYRQAQVVTAAVRRWHHGRYRATRSTRARELLTELGPVLLRALARTANPDAAFVKFDEFLGKLPAGVQLFSLFYANPELLDLVAEVMGSAPRLSGYLSRNPSLLDGVLSPGFFEPPPPMEKLARELDDALAAARDYEDVLDVTRRWAGDRKFQAGVQIMRNIADANAMGPKLTDIAEVLIRALYPCVVDEFAQRHGRVPEGDMGIVGLGKLGGRELTPASDLDLIFIYDCPEAVEASGGPVPLPISQYYMRLAQRIISAVTAPTAEGRLYDVDMRLRPSGTKGPIAVSLEGFARYHRESAWTWEKMALTRARVISGASVLATGIEESVRQILTARRDWQGLLGDVADMRLRIEREHGTANPWAVKQVRGGLVDLEFICQYLQLRHATEHPEGLHPNTTIAYERLRDAGVLEPDSARELIDATVLMRNVQGLLRLCSEGPFDEETAPQGLRDALARAAGVPGFAVLKEKLLKAQATAHRHFAALIDAPARTESANHTTEKQG